MAMAYLTPFARRAPAKTDALAASPLFDLHRQMDRLFDDLIGENGQAQGLGGRIGFPALDVSQDDKQIEICAELPGVQEDDIDLSIEDGVLTLCGEKKSARTDEERGYSERSYGRFERQIALPSNIDEDACDADFRDGVLTIKIPKSEEKARGRRIPLKKGKGQPSDAERALIDQKDDEPAKQQSGANA